jgi:hypothetical protein
VVSSEPARRRLLNKYARSHDRAAVSPPRGFAAAPFRPSIPRIICVYVGETAADQLNVNFGFDLTNTTFVTGALVVALLFVQFRLRRCVPLVYWSWSSSSAPSAP